MIQKVNLKENVNAIDELFFYKRVGTLNNHMLNVLQAQHRTSYSGDFQETYYSQRPIFQFNHEYFRVNEFLCKEKPFIVIECGTYDELIKNSMEDAEPFPYDLSNDKIKKEVKYSLGIEPYPSI